MTPARDSGAHRAATTYAIASSTTRTISTGSSNWAKCPLCANRCSLASGNAASTRRAWTGNPVTRTLLLARGGSVDPMAAYRAFRGRDPEIGPLLARRGLTG